MRQSDLIQANNQPFFKDLSPEEHQRLTEYLVRLFGILELDNEFYPEADLAAVINNLDLTADFQQKIDEKKEELRKLSREKFKACLLETCINAFKLMAIGQGQVDIPPLIIIPVYGSTNILTALRNSTRFIIDKQSYPYIPNHPNVSFGNLKHYIDKLIELLKNWQEYRKAEREITLARINSKETPQNAFEKEELIECEMQIASIRARVNAILYRYYLPKSQDSLQIAAE